MIKFFRKIRQSLLTQNKLGKYLIYAVGEIILVVIGILLALNINNKNEKRLSDEKITKILLEIQKNLETDITNSIDLFDNYMWSDSIQDLILTNKYTKEDYKSNSAIILSIFFQDFIIQTNGYDNLMLNIDNVPEKYQPLLEDLKFLYVNLKSNIDVFNERNRETVYKHIDHIYSFDWYQKSVKGIITEEEINYYLNDPQYKGEVIKYFNDFANVFYTSQDYKEKAKTTYHKISELIDSEEPLPELITSKPLDISFVDEVVGNYVLKESTGLIFRKKAQIKNEGGELFFSDSDGDNKLLRHNGNIFLLEFATGIYLIFNRTNKGELFISSNIKGNATYMKTED